MQWARDLLCMQGNGYAWTNPITPYIHILIRHLADILKKYKTLRIFSGQGQYIFRFNYLYERDTERYTFVFI